jgi:hypothetical protein
MFGLAIFFNFEISGFCDFFGQNLQSPNPKTPELHDY